MRQLYLAGVYLVGLLATAVTAAEPTFVYSSEGRFHRSVFMAELQFEEYETIKVSPGAIFKDKERYCKADRDLVAFGYDVANSLLAACNKSLLVGGVTKLEYQSLVVNYPDLNIVALYDERKPIFYVDTIKTTLPESEVIGIIYEKEDEPWALKLEKEARRVGLGMVLLETSQRMFIRDFKSLSLRVEAIVVPPRHRYFSKDILRPMLLISARSRVPVIGGLNEEHINKGVYTGLVVENGQLGREVAALYQKLEADGKTESSRFSYYLLKVNDYIAKSMGLAVNKDRVKDVIFSHEKN